jgi:acyl carrier protein phosphodiesterase
LLMNYLAHLLISEINSVSLTGGLLGDFVKNSEILHLSDRIRMGIDLHKKIDMYTDAHPIFISSKRLIKTERRRFSGILIDVFYDHFLAKNWDLYNSFNFSSFIDYAHESIRLDIKELPETTCGRLESMISSDVLRSYKEVKGIESALIRISKRISRENLIQDGMKDLEQNYEKLEKNFLNFFPDVISFSKNC